MTKEKSCPFVDLLFFFPFSFAIVLLGRRILLILWYELALFFFLRLGMYGVEHFFSTPHNHWFYLWIQLHCSIVYRYELGPWNILFDTLFNLVKKCHLTLQEGIKDQWNIAWWYNVETLELMKPKTLMPCNNLNLNNPHFYEHSSWNKTILHLAVGGVWLSILLQNGDANEFLSFDLKIADCWPTVGTQMLNAWLGLGVLEYSFKSNLDSK